MTLYIPDGYAEVTWLITVDGDPEPMTSSLGVNATAIDEAGVGAAATVLGFIVASVLELDTAASVGQDFNYLGYTWQGRAGGVLIAGEALSTVVGVGSWSAPPNNSALLIKKTTGFAGRGNRGRMFFPLFDMAETSVDSRGMLTSGALSDRQDQWTQILGDATADSAIDGLSLFHTITVAQPQPQATPITALTVQPQLGTQRRRMRP